MKIKYSRALMAGLCALPIALAGCGGGGGGGGGATSTTLTITPSLGKVVNADVHVIDRAGHTVGTGTIGASGVATVVATGTGPFTIEIVPTATSTYFDESTGTTRPLTATLHALVPSGTTNVGVTPLTELAHSMFLNNGAALSDTNVALANTAILNAFASSTALPNGILTPPAVVDTNTTPALGTGSGATYAAILAGLAQMGMGNANPALAVLDQLRRDVSDGALNGQEGSNAISGLLYSSTNFVTDFRNAVDNRVTQWGATLPVATSALVVSALTTPPVFTPPAAGDISFSSGTGLPATGLRQGRVNGGAACQVSVDAGMAVVNFGAYSYSVTLSPQFAQSVGGRREIGPLLYATGTVRNYSGDTLNAGIGDTIDLNFDGTGKLIYAYAGHITSTAIQPPAGANVNIWCAGSDYTSNTDVTANLPVSGPNAGSGTSAFAGTDLIGKYKAPLFADGTGSCNFTVNQQGGLVLNESPIPALANATTIDQSNLVESMQPTTAVHASWEYHPNGPTTGDWYLFIADKLADGSHRLQALTNGSNTKICSTNNDPAAKWLAVGTHSGTFTGSTQVSGMPDMLNGHSHNCAVSITSAGAVEYTASSGAKINTGPTTAGASIGPSTDNGGNPITAIDGGAANYALNFDFAHNKVTATRDFTLYDVCTYQ